MMNTSKLAQIAQEFRRYKLHILGLCETRWKNSGEKRLFTGETFPFSGKTLNADYSSGVGLLLISNAKNSLQDWTPISDRILKARFKTLLDFLLTFKFTHLPSDLGG